MCSRLAPVVLLLASAPVAGAQTLEDARARLADAVAVWREARANEAALPLDTVRAGPFIIVTGRAVVPRVRAAADSAADSLARLVGDAVRLMAPVRVVVPLGGDRAAWAGARWTTGLWGAWVSPRDTTLPSGLAGALLGPARVGFVSRGGDALMQWVGTFPAWTVPTIGVLERAYFELALKPTSVNRRCLVGDVAACQLALGIRTADDPVTELYDAEDRRRLVATRYYRRDEDRDRAHQCQDGDDDACQALLRSGRAGRQAPLSVPTRWTLLAVTLEAGGPDAWGSLVADSTAPLTARLAAAGGQPIDSLVADWQRRVVAAGNRPVLGTAATTWTAVLWIVGVLGLSLRSTRWRA